VQDVPTLVDLLRRAEGSANAGVRLLDRQGAEAAWLPWPAVWRRSIGVAGRLRALGVVPGDRVALVFPTGVSFIESFFGTVAAGAVPVPMYPPVRLGRLDEYHVHAARMLSAVGARLILADRRVRRLLGEATRRARPSLGCLTTDDLPAAGHALDAARADAAAPGDLALIQFSSGTTGDPHPVALSHRAVVSQAVALNSFWPDRDGVVHAGVSWLPLYHDMGLIGCLFPALERPGTVTLIPPEAFVASPSAWLRAISTYRATISPAPTFAYSFAADKVRDEELDGVDLSCWRVALCGAETVVPDVLRRFAARFARWGFDDRALTPVYGLSEASLAVTFSEPGRGVRSRRFERDPLEREGVARPHAEGKEIASVGRAIPGVEVRIAGNDGRALSEGFVGEVQCRGPSVMEGYYAKPDATAAAWCDGWLRTGDLGFTSFGELHLVGRLREILLLRGRNHDPGEVERAAEKVPGVRAGCVVAVSWLPEGADGERLLVLVEATRGTPPGQYPSIAAACARAIVEQTALAPDEIVVLAPGTLPRTSSGKLRRTEALRQYRSGELRPPAPVNAPRMARAVARSAWAFLRART
jgi:acyl-CoA synthetase (AMP-forming)/AMP-acid ligase II